MHNVRVSTVLRHVDHVDGIVTDQLDLVTVEQADDLFYPASNVLGKTFVIYRLAKGIACVEDVSTDSMHFNQLIFRQVLAGDRIMLNDAVAVHILRLEGFRVEAWIELFQVLAYLKIGRASCRERGC